MIGRPKQQIHPRGPIPPHFPTTSRPTPFPQSRRVAHSSRFSLEWATRLNANDLSPQPIKRCPTLKWLGKVLHGYGPPPSSGKAGYNSPSPSSRVKPRKGNPILIACLRGFGIKRIDHSWCKLKAFSTQPPRRFVAIHDCPGFARLAGPNGWTVGLRSIPGRANIECSRRLLETSK